MRLSRFDLRVVLSVGLPIPSHGSKAKVIVTQKKVAMCSSRIIANFGLVFEVVRKTNSRIITGVIKVIIRWNSFGTFEKAIMKVSR